MFDFPDTPTNGQIITGPSGVQYRWDGAKWVNGSVPNAYVAQGFGVFGTAPPAAKPAVTGSRGGNAAVASLLTALASYGLITDSSTA